VMLAPLQTQTGAEAFLSELAKAERPLLISYRNDDRLTFNSLVRLIGRNGFRVETSANVNDHEMLMRIAPARKVPVVSPCSVAVLAGGLTFGERLGRQMIASLLPGEADVHYVDLGDLAAARETYDLVVLGAGQGLFHPL